MNKLNQVLKRLEQAGFRANVRKCSFAADKVEYLGYDISRNGIHPQPKKVEAILKMQPPKTKRQLRRFLGMINYYRDMWQKRSHILAPLTSLSGKTAKWKWTKECTEAFESIKASMARETLLNFPDFNKEFHIFTDASNYQLGAVIMQDDKPLAFYSRKLNKCQRNYTTGEQELLSIVETLKEFHNILLGQKLIIHTDHLNILYSKMPSPRVVRWRLLLEEYGATFVHVKGEDNVVADTMSRHPTSDPDDDDDVTGPIGKRLSYFIARILTTEEDDKTEYTYADLVTPQEMLDAGVCALSPKVIAQFQKLDKELLRKSGRPKSNYQTVELEDEVLIAHNGKVMVPEALQDRLIDQYHNLLNHPGMTRMEATIRHAFDFRGLREKVEQRCRTCHICQLTKKQKKKYGHLPPKEAEEAIPWKRVNVDVVGPYTVETPKGKRTLLAMTMIDPATGWFEIAALENNDSYATQKALDSYWLARYPRPKYLGCDNGSHFKKYFRELVDNYGMIRKSSTEYNPQSNGIIERVHQVLGNALRNFEIEKRELDEHQPWDEFLSSAAFAIRSTHHTTLGASPAQLVFNRDMFLPIQFVADWTNIRLKRQKEINKSNSRENKSRIPHEYKIGDRILLTTPGILPKLISPRTGPYAVVNVHDNGTVTIRKGHVQQRVNIRRILPYRQGHRR
jgi:transposase InsO family protein